MLPEGTRSILVQPVLRAPNERANQMEKAEGFVLLASSISYAYSDKDRAWIGAVANKFRGKSIFVDLYASRLVHDVLIQSRDNNGKCVLIFLI